MLSALRSGGPLPDGRGSEDGRVSERQAAVVDVLQ